MNDIEATEARAVMRAATVPVEQVRALPRGRRTIGTQLRHTHEWVRRPDLDPSARRLGYACDCGAHGARALTGGLVVEFDADSRAWRALDESDALAARDARLAARGLVFGRRVGS